MKRDAWSDKMNKEQSADDHLQGLLDSCKKYA